MRLDEKALEAAAEAVYENFVYDGPDLRKPKWQPNGNALKQCEARDYAEAAITAYLAALPVPEWNCDMEKAPKELDPNNEITEENILILHDPDKEKWCRVTTGFWNANTNSWQACDDNVGKIHPVAWASMPSAPCAALLTRQAQAIEAMKKEK